MCGNQQLSLSLFVQQETTSHLSEAGPTTAPSILSKSMGALLQTGQFADMTFVICEGDGTATTADITPSMERSNSVSAHRVVVASRCDWFRRALTSGMKESIDRFV